MRPRLTMSRLTTKMVHATAAPHTVNTWEQMGRPIILELRVPFDSLNQAVPAGKFYRSVMSAFAHGGLRTVHHHVSFWRQTHGTEWEGSAHSVLLNYNEFLCFMDHIANNYYDWAQMDIGEDHITPFRSDISADINSMIVDMLERRGNPLHLRLLCRFRFNRRTRAAYTLPVNFRRDVRRWLFDLIDTTHRLRFFLQEPEQPPDHTLTERQLTSSIRRELQRILRRLEHLPRARYREARLSLMRTVNLIARSFFQHAHPRRGRGIFQRWERRTFS